MAPTPDTASRPDTARSPATASRPDAARRPATASRRPRRTQAERVEETRTALVEATIASLVEVGYAALTTRDVAERAGVSRGAQTHHFPTKTDLVLAAIEHLFAVQATRFRTLFAAVPAERRDLGAALELLWSIVTGPTYAAVLEVTVAARTDPELRVVVRAMAVSLEQTVLDLLREFFPAFADDPDVARALVDVGFSLVQGAAVSAVAGFGRPEQGIALAERLARLLTPDVAALLKGAVRAIDGPDHP